MSGATWDDLGGFTWADLGRLTWEQLERWSRDVWSELRALTPEERVALLDAVTGAGVGHLRVTWEAGSPDQRAALGLFDRYAPKNAAEMAAYLGVLVALLTFLTTQYRDEEPPTAPPPAQVVIVNVPPEHHPEGPPPAADLP